MIKRICQPYFRLGIEEDLMSTNTFLTILGMVLALILSGVTCWLTLRQRYPGQITYFEESCIGLFDSIVRNLPDLKVLYKSDPVSENIVLLKGYFFNTGSKDITTEMVEKPVTLKLPERFKWLDGKVVSPQDSLKVSLQIKDDITAKINFGLFRVNEYAKFELLAQVPVTDPVVKGTKIINAVGKLRTALMLVCRIADCREVLRKRIPASVISRKVIPIFVLFLFMGMFAATTGFLSILGGLPANQELHFTLEPQTGDTLETKIIVDKNGMLALKGGTLQSGMHKNVEKFLEGYKIKPKVVELPNPFLLRYGLGSLLIVIGYFCVHFSISGWIEYKDTKRIRKLLSLD